MARQPSFDRDDILKKAMELFWSKGFQGTSLKDLETVLDLRPGSIYAAFGSKEALFAETLDLYSRESGRQLRKTLDAAPSPLAGLASHMRRLGCIVTDEPPSKACMLVKTLLELPENDRKLRQMTEDLIKDAEAVFRGAFQASKDAGEIDENADPDILAARLQSEIFGLRAYAQRAGSDRLVPRLAEGIAREIEALAVRKPEQV
ncbi:TetR/AcrR family transcriptional regulator [Stappia sp.]|uniref:TetR/AcrR family transcriptional regulator n=1 Tax=Stappia sp. TaxID=1870903 RepID=UPI003A9943DB